MLLQHEVDPVHLSRMSPDQHTQRHLRILRALLPADSLRLLVELTGRRADLWD